MDAPTISDKPAAAALLRANVRRMLADRRGATAVEYGLVVALIVLAMFGALADLGNVTTAMWNNVNSKVTNAH